MSAMHPLCLAACSYELGFDPRGDAVNHKASTRLAQGQYNVVDAHAHRCAGVLRVPCTV